MNDPTTMRRSPKQLRSQQRVDDILDAAARLFREVGYEAATTNAIAGQAQVPIGSLYQFFPNKESILKALAQRYTDQMRDLHARTLSPTATEGLPLAQVIGGYLQAMGEFEAAHVAFRLLFLSAEQTQTHEMQAEIIQRVDDLLAARFPLLRPERRRQAASASVGIVKGLMIISGEPATLSAEQSGDEIITALLGYIRAVLVQEALPLPPDLA
ncbi:MAG: TetR/AcrR family transcriptional regulator [Anaerolineae bacterium]|nr:TetR/AcrR family transcriptional regulator [Anaerolineae bacterium]